VNFAGSGSASTASRSDHDHTGTYAASTHGHAGTDITSGTVAEARIDSAIARVSDVTAHTSRTDNPHLVTALQVGAASAGHNHDTAYQAKYKRTLVVSPIGTAVENADALLAALNGITDASATNPYLLKIEPGIYDVGTSPVQMKQFVDIEGSGETATRITGSGSSSSLTGTLKGANNAELRFLTVENTGGDAYATAIRNGLTSPRITHVTARASGTTGSVTALWNESSSAIMIDVTLSASGGTHTRGVNNTTSSTLTMTNVTATASGASGTNTGIMNNSSSPIMKNVTATAQGGTDSYGVRNYSSSSPTMTNVIASASDASNHNYGVYNSVTGTGFTMMNVTATASGGSGDNFGVFNSSDAEFTMKNVIATATGAPNQNCGVLNSGSSSIMNEVIATAQGGTIAVGITNTCSTSTILNCTAVARDGTQNYGVYNQSCGDSYTVKINNSRIVGSTSTIRNHTGFATYVGASQLNGGDVTLNGGTFTCISVYDENYAGLNGSCQ
jgi:hypothetical protein